MLGVGEALRSCAGGLGTTPAPIFLKGTPTCRCGGHGQIQDKRACASSPAEVFSKLGLPRSCNQPSPGSWNELSSGPSYFWDSPATEPSPSWPASSSSPTHTATVSTGLKPMGITTVTAPRVVLTDKQQVGRAWPVLSSSHLLRRGHR